MKSTHHTWTAILLSLLAVALWGGYKLYTGRQLEDSLITFRYVQNILAGDGFVFNPNERVLGTTTPLFTLLLTAFTAPLGASSVIVVADTLSILASLGSSWLIYLSLKQKDASLGLAAALIFAVNPVTIWSTAGGMETVLVLFLMFLAWYLAHTGRLLQSGIAAGLLALARPDTLAWTGLIFLGLIAKASQTRSWREIMRWSAAAVLTALPWIVFAWLYFGSPLPNTVAAKLTIDAQSRELSIASFGVVLQLAGITNGTWQPLSLAQFTLFLPGAIVMMRWRGLWWIFPIYSIVFSALLYFGNAPFADWYWVPCKITALVTSVVGAYTLAQLVARTFSNERITTATFALFAIATIGYSGWKFYETIERDREYQLIEEQTRKATGEWLKHNTAPNARVLAEPIGYVGYYSDRYIIDLAGLVSPRVVKLAKEQRSASNAQLFRSILWSEVPDVIILRTFEVRDNRHFHGGPLFEDSTARNVIRDHYYLAKQFIPPAEYGESRAFDIYVSRHPRYWHN